MCGQNGVEEEEEGETLKKIFDFWDPGYFRRSRLVSVHCTIPESMDACFLVVLGGGGGGVLLGRGGGRCCRRTKKIYHKYMIYNIINE